MADRDETVAGRWAWPALACIAGVALQLQQPALWPEPANLALMAAGLLLGLAGRRHAAWLALGAALLAFGSTAWRADLRLQQRLAPALEGQDLVLTGLVAGLPRVSLQGQRFVFEVESATLGGAAVSVPPRVSLGWTRGWDDAGWLPGPGVALRAGQRWQLPARLKQPHGTMNPHGFDFELWMFEQGLGAVGSVRPGARLLAEDAGVPVERWRQALRDRIEARLAEDPLAANVLSALALGDQASIEHAEWDLFRATGVAHLMSISGLHVTMIAWLAGALVGAGWRRSTRLVLWLPVPQAARWGGLAAALAYALLAGWGVPAQRTVGMIAVVVALRSLGLRWSLQAVLLAAGAAVTLADPWALLQPGFWLSFVAVAMLVASEPARAQRGVVQGAWPRLRQVLAGGLRSQAIATVGLAPLSMLFFQQLSLVGFAANLVAIPLVTLVITPLALVGVLLPPLWAPAAWSVHALVGLLGWLAQAPLAVWQAAAAPPWAVAAGLLGGLVAVLPLPRRWRVLALPLMLPLLSPVVARPGERQAEVVAADIGQGTAVLVRTARHLLVFDTGPAWSADADAGGRVLLPLLRTRGEAQVDLLMLSHRDSDHVGGAASLMRGLPVRALSTSLADGHPLLANGPPHTRCEAGQSWAWDGVVFTVLHPSAAEWAAASTPNAGSCVLRVDTAAGRVLITADIEAAQEAALLARRADLRADVLLVPHHGSRTSSTPAFIDAVHPAVAVFQAGYRSRYGHPAPDVVQRYQERGIGLVRSDRCGAWTWPVEGGGGQCEREVSRRYWHHQP